ncbi:MAG: hypothetical protein ACK578_03280 [Pirellula sp.]|jgi:hypothetical protein
MINTVRLSVFFLVLLICESPSGDAEKHVDLEKMPVRQKYLFTRIQDCIDDTEFKTLLGLGRSTSDAKARRTYSIVLGDISVFDGESFVVIIPRSSDDEGTIHRMPVYLVFFDENKKNGTVREIGKILANYWVTTFSVKDDQRGSYTILLDGRDLIGRSTIESEVKYNRFNLSSIKTE